MRKGDEGRRRRNEKGWRRTMSEHKGR